MNIHFIDFTSKATYLVVICLDCSEFNKVYIPIK